MTVPGRSLGHADVLPRDPADSRRRRLADVLRLWRSPPDQPPWARPALLAITALATLGYAWSIGNVNLEPFYGAAARSVSQSWHNFIFGAFDPWGTVTVDKLPGALWIQALSLRLFGFHLWAIVLPQVVEGALTVLVLYRAVRRVAYADSVPPSVAADVFESSYVASLDVLATGREFLPVGGFTGEVPEPSLPQFIRDVARGRCLAPRPPWHRARATPTRTGSSSTARRSPPATRCSSNSERRCSAAAATRASG
jgi:hypothetical protein